jgi:hypothetical protein
VWCVGLGGAVAFGVITFEFIFNFKNTYIKSEEVVWEYTF